MVSSRTFRWAAVPVAVVVVGLIVTFAGIRSSPGVHPQSAPTTPVKIFAPYLDASVVDATTTIQWATIARRNAVVVLNSWDYHLIPVLKRANPTVKVWVYKDLSGVRSDDCLRGSEDCGSCPQGVMDSAYLSSGIGYCWLKRNHPNWLLDSASTGQPFQFTGYPKTWESDYGDPVYQRQWVSDVLADVNRHGWDGVLVDNALTVADAYGVAAKYPTDAAVQAATYSALQRIGPALTHASVASVFNVGYAPMFPGLWQRWLAPVDGLEQEFYLSYSTQPNAFGDAWSSYNDEVSSCVALNKSCWFHSGGYSPAVTAQTQEYALASFLLAANSRQLLSIGDITPDGTLWQWALGAPITAMEHSAGVWRRYFVHGIAIVNNTTSELAVSLGGTYVDDSGHSVSAVTLPPASGAVFLRSS